VSIPQHARRRYGAPQIDLDGTAIALGGYISEVRNPPEAKEYTPCKVPIAGSRPPCRWGPRGPWRRPARS
jgi:hypothetical protein